MAFATLQKADWTTLEKFFNDRHPQVHSLIFPSRLRSSLPGVHRERIVLVSYHFQFILASPLLPRHSSPR